MKILIFLLLALSASTIANSQNCEWILVEQVPQDVVDPGGCTVQSNCDGAVVNLCYALVHTSPVTTNLTSYTTFFRMDCPTDGSNNHSITYNESCIMTDNSTESIACPTIEQRFNSSGNGDYPSTQAGQTYILHTVCFNVPLGESLTVQARTGTVQSNASYGSNANGDFQTVDLTFDDLVINTNTACALLPVELTSFTAESVELDAKLDWSTATEVNNEKFVIERSFGGKDFMEIATVSGAGNSTSPQHYNFVDEGVGYVTGKAYYRLKQVDYDGTFTYSDVRSVSFDNNSAISIYPTISTDAVNVEIKDLDSQNSVECKLVDQLGQVLKRMELSSNGTIDISTLPPAIYYLQIKDQRGTVDLVEKITKI